MEKLQLECEQYKLYSPDSLKYITDNIYDILISKIKEYKEIFNITDFDQLQINYFDDLEKFRNFIYDLRGEKRLPKYARGTYDRGMINAFIQNNILTDSPTYKSKLYLANHELFHILYMKYILQNDYSKRIVWYDEGMAQFMSGEKDELLDIDTFKQFYENVKKSTTIVPDLNLIGHGDSFINDDYDGYYLSYLAIRYLNEVLDEDEFINLMRNFEQIRKYGKIVLNDMFEYYDKKLLTKVLIISKDKKWGKVWK